MTGEIFIFLSHLSYLKTPKKEHGGRQSDSSLQQLQENTETVSVIVVNPDRRREKNETHCRLHQQSEIRMAFSLSFFFHPNTAVFFCFFEREIEEHSFVEHDFGLSRPIDDNKLGQSNVRHIVGSNFECCLFAFDICVTLLCNGSFQCCSDYLSEATALMYYSEHGCQLMKIMSAKCLIITTCIYMMFITR